MTDLEKEHRKILRLLNGCINTFELVRLYFPNYSDKRSARNAFRRTIEQTSGMMAELVANGYKETNHTQTPRINMCFVRHWGTPDAVLLLLDEEMKRMF